MSAELDALRDTLRKRLRHEVAAAGGIPKAAAHWPAMWSAARDMGLGALGADPALGGVDTLCAVLEESGYAGAPFPVLPAFLANRLLGTPASDIADGSAVPCLRLAGDRLVEFAESATHLLAIDEPAQQIRWLDLRGGARVAPQPGLSPTPLCDVRVPDGVAIQAPAVAGVRNLIRLALVARALGATHRAYELAVEHARTRQQFGQPIGRFQAIQHKLADCLTRIDAVRLQLDAAVQAAETDPSDAGYFAAAVFAFANPALRQTMLEVHHVLGAIGFAEEHDAPHHFRRVHADLVQAGGVREAREALAARVLVGDRPSHRLGDSAETVRREVRQWLAANLDPASQQGGGPGWDADFSRRMAAGGWIGTSWPKPFGNGRHGVLEQFVVIEEMYRADAPNSYHAASEMLIGPALIAFGTPEQQARILPGIRSGALSICLGYSEPQAGSDLASLRTRAVRDGDGWRITGQKLWTTGMEHAQYIWLAARTNADAQPPHAGISIFLVPLGSPGIVRQPSTAFYGHPFTTSFWDEVYVPGDALVGAVDGGWKVMSHALAAERLLMGGNVARLEALFTHLCAHVAADPVLRERADTRQKIGELAAEVEAARQLVVRTVRQMAAGGIPMHEAAMCKAYSGELMERLSEAGLDLLGPTALLAYGAHDAPCSGRVEQMLRTSIMMVIGGGTNEIQRNLIALKGVGLPR